MSFPGVRRYPAVNGSAEDSCEAIQFRPDNPELWKAAVDWLAVVEPRATFDPDDPDPKLEWGHKSFPPGSWIVRLPSGRICAKTNEAFRFCYDTTDAEAAR